MLKGINPLMTPELLTALARMGHGDTIAVVDSNYPAYATGRPWAVSTSTRRRGPPRSSSTPRRRAPYGCRLPTKGVLPSFGPEPAS